ncbi:RagB/SusD family nutrient uptake outer membrane protein [Ravibacter arvi]|uniref:RagB/SusD family nutrient uptake outer membrane protein n=1 Tax=Ravibacter arvi TaxID=2051041 RepID=A0ABP8LW30_9BACT
MNVNKFFRNNALATTVLASISLAACDDAFLNVLPETEITADAFFATPNDLEIYSNQFYTYLVDPVNDRGSDNVVATAIDNEYAYKLMRGVVNPDNVEQWSGHWNRLRTINFMLERTHQTTGSAADINHFVGIGRFFRALHYYELVRQYSDVPWYGRTLKTTDTDLLYKKQDPRAVVVDSVLADLKFAVDHIKPSVDGKTSKVRLTKYAALAALSRIALEEGTTRKYRTELGLADGNRFLEISRDASRQLIDANVFSIFRTNAAGERKRAYEAMFNSESLASNPEMILIREYSLAEGITNLKKTVFNENHGLSRDLLEDYLALTAAGEAVPFQEIAGYRTMAYWEVFKNRDPRLNQTFMQPGFKMPGNPKIAYPNWNIGGYPQVKSYPTDADQIDLGGGRGHTDNPVYRLAEIYLNYAEAKAELGELTQADLDQAIKPLRDRVGMPAPVLSEWLASTDPRLAAKYTNVTSPQKGAILEIRRERRVELACEGLRLNDLRRWKAGQLAAVAPLGSYISQLGAVDISGDGVPEFYISQNGEGFDKVREQFPGVEIFEYKLNASPFELTEGDKGFIRIKAQNGIFSFPEKYYYKPVSNQDILVNPNLVQHPLWK